MKRICLYDILCMMSMDYSVCFGDCWNLNSDSDLMN